MDATAMLASQRGLNNAGYIVTARNYAIEAWKQLAAARAAEARGDPVRAFGDYKGARMWAQRALDVLNAIPDVGVRNSLWRWQRGVQQARDQAQAGMERTEAMVAAAGPNAVTGGALSGLAGCACAPAGAAGVAGVGDFVEGALAGIGSLGSFCSSFSVPVRLAVGLGLGVVAYNCLLR